MDFNFILESYSLAIIFNALKIVDKFEMIESIERL